MTTDEYWTGVNLRAKVRELERQLADAQADYLRLREAIDRQPYTMDKDVCEALATQPGDLSVLREVCAKVLDEASYKGWSAVKAAANLRSGRWPWKY